MVAEKGQLFKKNDLPRLEFENRELNLLTHFKVSRIQILDLSGSSYKFSFQIWSKLKFKTQNRFE